MQFVAIFSYLCAFAVTAAAYFTLRRSVSDVIAVLFYWYAVMFLLRGLFLVTGLDGPFPDYMFAEHFGLVSAAMLYYTLWVICVVIGALVFGDHAPGIGRLLPAQTRLPHPGALAGVLVVMTALSLVINVLVTMRYGGFNNALVAIKVQKDLGGFYVLRQAAAIGVLLAAVSFPILGRLREQGWPASSISMYRAISLVCFLITAGGCYLWGARTPIGVALVIWLGWPVVRSGRIRVMSAAILGGITLGILYILRLARDIMSSGNVASTIESETLVRKLSVALNLVPLDAFMVAIRDWPARYPYRLGEDFYNGLVGFIPRSIWADKPKFTSPGAWFRQVYEPEKVNGWPFTIVGEWFVNFGFFGVVAGGLLTGWVFRAAQIRYGDHSDNPTSWMMAILIVFYCFQGGMWTQSLIFYVLFLIPLFVIFYVLDRATVAAGGIPATSGRGRATVMVAQ